VSGFHDQDGNAMWSLTESSLISTGRRRIYLSCNYLRPGESRSVQVECEGVTQTLLLDDAYACYQLDIGKDYPTLVRFKGDGAVVPKEIGLNMDSRSLSFEVWLSAPSFAYIANLPESESEQPLIYCVFDSKKEEDSLRPLHAALQADGLRSVLVPVQGALDRLAVNGSLKNANFLVAASIAYAKLFNAGCRGRFMYAEHGAAPLKKYTYGKHYARYDLVLLPGDLWVERLAHLYPSTVGRCHSIGYAKLRAPALLSVDERTSRLKHLGLNPDKKVILFAPSWSSGERGRGIFNVQHFDKSTNLITIPHDGDNRFAAETAKLGYNIHTLAKGETISDYYDLADILVSDVSSTAVEFAALGRPVICISINYMADFDNGFREGPQTIRVPHTERYWDFCPVVAPEAINQAIEELLTRMDSGDAGNSTQAVSALLRCYGEESAQLGAEAIRTFLGQPLVAGQKQ
jgi:hypothetical protein